MRNTLNFGLLLSLGITQAYASIQVNVTSPVREDSYTVGVGSSLSLNLSEFPEPHAGTFLGKLVDPDGSFSKYMLLDQTNSTIYLSDQSDTTFTTTALQPVLRQYDQVDDTCTGYAIDHFLQQIYWSGFVGNGALKETLSTEYGRSQLLVESIDDYYLATQHRNSIEGILKNFGTRFGFSCPKKMFKDSESAIQFVESSLKTGFPVLVSFFIGPDMVDSNLKTIDYESKAVSDDRLWIPRQIGERNSGGHSVVAAAEFEFQGRKKLLMLDSDWHEPRVWDLEEYLGGKAAISEIEFYACDGSTR